MTEYNSIDEILAENARRRSRLELPFNPISGYNSVGRRMRLNLPDYVLKEQFLPESMAEEQLVLDLRRCGSIAALAGESGRMAAEIAEALLRLRMLHDFPFWAATAVYIKRKGGGEDVRFRLNRPQRRLVEEFEKMRLDRQPVRLILLKARQWGGSTCAQLYMAWLQLFHCIGLNSLIIAHQGSGSDEIKDMFDRMISTYPPELLYPQDHPDITSGRAMRCKKLEHVGKSGSIFRVPQRNCKIKVGTAERPDSCRGGDYNLVHLSEVGLWPSTRGKSPEDIVRSACGGVLLRPMTMIIYESTANGTGNFFHREYMAALRGESQFRPMFVSWFEIDQYSLPFDSPEEERALAERIFTDRHDTTESGRRESGSYIWRLFLRGATLEAINWYLAERGKYNDHADMAAEYPSDDIEAFSHSGCRVFDRYHVERLRAGCRRAEIRGEIVSSSPDGPDCLRSLHLDTSASGGMEFWKLPEPERKMRDRFLVVVDVGGRSAKADWSVITVFDRKEMARGGNPEVAAQWRGHCDADILAWRAARVAQFYDEALLVVESNTMETREQQRNLDGDQMPYIILQIKEAYPNLYMRSCNAESVGGGASH